MVRNSWNPGRVDPSARFHCSAGAGMPAMAVLPVTGPVVGKAVLTSMTRVAVNVAADVATTEMSRSGPTLGSSIGSTARVERGSTVTTRVTGGAESAKLYSRAT